MITPKLDLFFCRQGYIRLATDTYSLNNKDKFRHLTNNCLQKYSKNYKKEDDIISPSLLENEIRQKVKADFNYQKELIPEIITIIRFLGIVMLRNKKEIYEKKEQIEDPVIKKKRQVKWFCDCGNTFIRKEGKLIQ